MSDVSKLIADMVREGVSPELIGRVAQAIADAAAVSQPVDNRSSAALRQERYRQRKASQTVTSDVTRDASPERNETVTKRNKSSPRDASLARVEDNPSFLEIEPQEVRKKESKAREPSPKEILMGVLSEETADAVIAHRKAKKSPISTALAARGLVKAFAEFPGGPQAAAEMMVTNGWTGFKREYWENANGNRGSPSPPKVSQSQMFGQFAEFLEQGNDGSADGEAGERTVGGAVRSIPHFPRG